MVSANLAKNALTIEAPSADHLKLNDSRRLSGPGMLWNHPGAVLDVFFYGFSADNVSQVWRREARRVLDAINWSVDVSTGSYCSGGSPAYSCINNIFKANMRWIIKQRILVKRGVN